MGIGDERVLVQFRSLPDELIPDSVECIHNLENRIESILRRLIGAEPKGVREKAVKWAGEMDYGAIIVDRIRTEGFTTIKTLVAYGFNGFKETPDEMERYNSSFSHWCYHTLLNQSLSKDNL